MEHLVDQSLEEDPKLHETVNFSQISSYALKITMVRNKIEMCDSYFLAFIIVVLIGLVNIF